MALAAPFYFTFSTKFILTFNDLEYLSEKALHSKKTRTEYTKHFRYLFAFGRISEVK